MEYKVVLSEEQERFLDLYFKVRPLRPEHKRTDYPHLVVNNWVNSLMRMKDKFLKMYEEVYGRRWEDGIQVCQTGNKKEQDDEGKDSISDRETQA